MTYDPNTPKQETPVNEAPQDKEGPESGLPLALGLAGSGIAIMGFPFYLEVLWRFNNAFLSIVGSIGFFLVLFAIGEAGAELGRREWQGRH